MDKAYYAEKGLFIGVASIISAFYFFAPTFFTFKSSLITQSGEVTDVRNFYIPVVGSRGSKSIKSEVKFTLSSTTSVYVLMENIGQSRYNEKFEMLAKQLKNSGNATVWIKESQKNKLKPTVFQIADKNDKILFDFEESKSNSRYGFLISFGLGIFGIGLYLWHKYSGKASLQQNL